MRGLVHAWIGTRASMDLRNCHNFHDFRRLAKRRLPGPIFDYIDGAADEETTHRRNTEAFESCDLVPRSRQSPHRNPTAFRPFPKRSFRLGESASY